MPKTLEEAIGCWTVNEDYNSLTTMSKKIRESATGCKRATLRGEPELLSTELNILNKRLEAMQELTVATIDRLKVIVGTDELQKEN